MPTINEPLCGYCDEPLGEAASSMCCGQRFHDEMCYDDHQDAWEGDWDDEYEYAGEDDTDTSLAVL